MASQSKLLLSHVSTPGQRERTIRSIISHLTELYLSNRTRISRAVYLTLFVALVNRVRNAIAEQKAASARDAAKRAERSGTTGRVDDAATEDGDGKKKKRKVELDREFFRSLLRLMRIVVPGWRSKETRLLISHSFFLVVRTLISLKVAAMDGAIVKALVKGNGKEFLKRIVWWMLIAVPATFTNSMVGLAWNSGEIWWARCWKSWLTIPRNTVVVAPSGVVTEIQDETNPAHSRQVPVKIDLLRHIGAGR